MDYSLYESIIIKRMVGFSLISIICIVASLCCMIYAVKHKEQFGKGIFIVLILFSAFCSFMLFDTLYTCGYDIKNKAYITFEGEFSIPNEYKNDSRLYIYENGKNISLNLHRLYNIVKSGDHQGRVVYGKKTKLVLDIYYYE